MPPPLAGGFLGPDGGALGPGDDCTDSGNGRPVERLDPLEHLLQGGALVCGLTARAEVLSRYLGRGVKHRVPQVAVDRAVPQSRELFAVQVFQPLGDRVRRLGQQDFGSLAAEEFDGLLQDLDPGNVKEGHPIQVEH